jgi:O-antigen/teichoic acid export membrane protein
VFKKILNTTSLKANIFANFLGNGWSAVIGLIFVPLYLKYIGAEGYGLIGIFASLQVLLSLLDSGLSTTLNKEISRLIVLQNRELQLRNLVKTLGTIYWIVASVASLIALCLSPLIARYWVHPIELSVSTITNAFLLLSLSIAFQFPVGFYSGGLLGMQRQVMLNLLRIIFSTIKNVGALLVLVFVSKSVLVFFLWNLIIVAIQAFVFKYFVWYYLPTTKTKAIFDKQEFKNVWRFAAGMLGISLTAILLTQVDKIILSKILSLEAFGYYTIACSLGLIIYQIIGPLTQSYFPKFSSLLSLEDIEGLKKTYHQGSQLISVLVFPTTCMLVFFSKDLIYLWTGNEITSERTWLVASIYALGTGLNGLMNLPYFLTLTYNWTKLAFYQNLVFLILMVPLTIYLATTYGAMGGALSWAVINILYFFVTPSLIHKKLLKGEKQKWYWNDNIKILVPCVIVFLLGKYSILKLTDFNTVYRYTFVFICGIIAITISFMFANTINYKAKNYLKKQLKSDK